MTLINIRNLGVTLSAPLFSRLNLVVNAGDRIGLSPPTVAENPPCCAAWQALWKRAKARSPDPGG